MQYGQGTNPYPAKVFCPAHYFCSAPQNIFAMEANDMNMSTTVPLMRFQLYFIFYLIICNIFKNKIKLYLAESRSIYPTGLDKQKICKIFSYL